MVTNSPANTPTGTSGTVLQGRGAGNPLALSTATYPSSSSGTGKILYDNGTNFIESVPTFPASASATNRKIIVSDGTNWVASTETWATPGTSGNVLTSDGTNWTSAASSGGFAPNKTIQIFDDFIGSNGGTVVTSVITWQNGSGTFSWTGTTPTVENGHPGILASPALSGASFISLYAPSVAANSFVLGGGAITLNWVFKINTLSTGTLTYTLNIGLGDTATSSVADQANGLYFKYSSGVNSGNWEIVSASASTLTTTTTSTAAATGWHNAQIAINAAGTSATYTLDGVSLGTINTNIPTTAINPLFLMERNAGTLTANSIVIDLFYLTQTLTTAR